MSKVLRRFPVAAAAVLLLCAAGAAGAGEPSTAAPAGTPVPQALLLAFLADPSTLTLIDARSPEEFAAAHIAGAVNIPHDAADSGLDALPADHDKPIVVYCRTGKRAALLRYELAKLGYRDVRILQPQQIFWAGGLAVFNCGTPRDPPDLTSAARARDSGEERK